MTANEQQDLDQVAANVFAQQASAVPSVAQVEGWLEGFAEGCFADIVYPVPSGPVDVAALSEHLRRLKAISMRVSTSAADPVQRYLEAALLAADFYVSQDYRPHNWYDRQISLAGVLASSAVRLASVVPRDALAGVIAYLAREANVTDVDGVHTGANLADFTAIQIRWSCAGWINSGRVAFAERLLECTTALRSLCMPVGRSGPERGEGISVDYSFSQHNVAAEGRLYHQLYTGSYCYVYLRGLFDSMKVLHGAFALGHAAVAGLKAFMARGVGWHSYAGKVDWHPNGRAISRGDQGNGFLPAFIDQLAPDSLINPDDRALRELRERSRTGVESNNTEYVGTRLFWVNDYLAHLTPEFGLWVKAVSTRTVGTESGNGENLKGYYMGAGSYFLLREGGEYVGMQPVWDWQKIPGTTVEQDPDFDWPQMPWGREAWGSHDFVGGASGGQVGVLSMVLSRQRVDNAYKTVCTLADQVVCLGADIDTRRARHEVQTTLNQCLRRGAVEVRYANGHCKLLGEEEALDDPGIVEVRHAGLAYFIAPGQRVKVASALRRGRWRDINTSGSEAWVSATVFSLSLVHSAARPRAMNTGSPRSGPTVRSRPGPPSFVATLQPIG